jgi:hypothetical protein
MQVQGPRTLRGRGRWRVLRLRVQGLCMRRLSWYILQVLGGSKRGRLNAVGRLTGVGRLRGLETVGLTFSAIGEI